MATIAITGVAGLVGRALVAALDADGSFERVLGLDLRAPDGVTSSRLSFRQQDVRDPGLADALRGADALVHLALSTGPTRDRDAARSLNVDGTRNVFEAAAAAGVEHVVYLSSVVVYGAHPDNDFPLTEDSPLRGTPDFDYAEDKLAVERWLWPWLEAHSGLDVAVLRSAIIAGPGVQNFLSRLFEQPRLVVVRGHRPPLQVVHLEDVVAAIVHASRERLAGPFNLCAEGWLSFDEVRGIVGRPTLELPEEVAFSVVQQLWRFGLGEQPPGIVSYLMHPWVMSAQRLVDAGWRPRHTNRDALAELVREHRGYVAIAGLRARRQTVRNASLGLAGLAGLAALASVRRARRRAG